MSVHSLFYHHVPACQVNVKLFLLKLVGFVPELDKTVALHLFGVRDNPKNLIPDPDSR
ncbi:hypothetical protein LM595_00880 [Candidatus Acetothermia bacterium]|nr:hypothetical protein [Candidatus Acetothermia bacterium]